MIFTILCPDYVHYSAGVRVLWRLGDVLGRLGHKVYYINYQNSSTPTPAWSTMEPAPNNTTQGTIIAPETFPELNCPHVRWALNKPGLLGGPSSYGEGVQVFHWSPELEESAKKASLYGTSIPFMMGILDKPDLTPISKTLTIWYRGKYQGPIDLQDHVNQIEMTRHWPSTKQQYWELMNQTQKLYSYDDFSGTNLEGHLWGADVYVWDGTQFNKYQPPAYIHKLLIDAEQDLISVSQFVDNLQL